MVYSATSNVNKTPTPAAKLRTEAIWSQHSGTNLAKPLIEPGKDIRELLMHTIIRDENELKMIIAALDYCDEIGLDDARAIVGNYIAGKCSIGGQSRMEYVESLTGIMLPDIHGAKNKIWGKKAKSDNNDGNNNGNHQNR